ncbi:MAG: nucleotidyl transferase AbiEii/AbiGii toxin family protein [Selenomonas sp.]|uniref:nucleotidyl transferase AbiEii/AbiGii toxin family protein n=1 Tax=Selenomonas sp. TaxID=2053611 RepID=UPI0025EB770B|nr:nucleotidyl transferase AbiEii/AbiGii toxin family protein [Selenomonas sp.]MCR5438500.1 nucleotidyl transferase AbiEii/AbiGii toxin family protein [Selenomonas sp.]
MKLTSAQLKGRLKKLATQHHADARTLMRLYMMERFLERISASSYRDNFIIKGGILVTSLIGVALRSTMDIDTTIKNLNLSDEDIRRIVDEICTIDLQDDVKFQVKQLSRIMDEMDYPGIRVTLNAFLGNMPVPMKIDISTGDVITPREIHHQYKLLLEDRTILLWSYNLETLLSEKIQTVLARGQLNTRMRDFYDLYELSRIYRDKIDVATLQSAFTATCAKRNTQNLLQDAPQVITKIQQDNNLMVLWKSYQKKYTYAINISYDDIMLSLTQLWELIKG